MMEKNDAINKESALDRMLVKSCKSHVVFFNGESRKAIQDNKYILIRKIDRFVKVAVPSRTRYGALYRAIEVLQELSNHVLPCVKFVIN